MARDLSNPDPKRSAAASRGADDLLTELRMIEEALDDYSRAVKRLTEQYDRQIAGLWADSAERRDELHAVSNRLESLTVAVTTDPAEVAEKIMRLRDADL